MRTPRILSVLVLGSFLMTGCMKLDMEATVDAADDTISGSFIVAVDKKVLTLNNRTVEQGFGDTQKDLTDVPEGERTEVYDDGPYYGRRIIYDRRPLGQFSQFRHEQGRYVFEADGSGFVGRAVPEVAEVVGKVEIVIRITFPGKVIEHDPKATLRGDNTVVWKLRLAEFKKIRAVSEERPAFPWMLLALVAGLFGVLVVAAIVVVVMRMNRRPQAEMPVD